VSKSKHTPGPWSIGQSGSKIVNPRSTFTAIHSGGASVCLVVEGNGRAGDNSRLIAAAPDLLAACKAMAAIDIYGKAMPKGFMAALDQIEAAIAKAEGR
jgi:hypothetical protein